MYDESHDRMLTRANGATVGNNDNIQTAEPGGPAH